MSRIDQLAAWSEQADRAAHEGRWVDAAGLLENIRAVDSGYPDLTRRLTVAVARRQEQAEVRRQQLSELHVRAGRADAGGRVDEAIAALAQLVALDPANTEAARRLQALRQQSGAGDSSAGPGRPVQAGRRARTWIIAAVAAALVLALVAGAVLLREQIVSAFGGPSSTPSVLPSSTEPSTPSPEPTAGVAGAGLRDHVPGAIRPDCDDYAPPVSDGLAVNLTGALRCELGDDNAPATVWYLAYTDGKAMKAAWKPFTEGTFVAGDCRAENQRFVYSDTEPGDVKSGGVLLCYESEQGETYFAWTHDDLAVLSLAADPDLSFPRDENLVGAGRAGPVTSAVPLRSGWNHNSAYYPWITEHAYAVRGRALDVGCGAGMLLDRLSPVCTHVTGIDTDPVAVARATARTAGRANVTVRLDSLLTADLPEQGFELVTFVASLHHLDLLAGLRRGAALVAPGGRLLVVGLSRPASPADWLVLGLSTPIVRLLDRWHGLDPDDGGTVLADPRESLAEIRRTAATVTPGARIRYGLHYRYLQSWTRP